jgi:hypothetical protein
VVEVEAQTSTGCASHRRRSRLGERHVPHLFDAGPARASLAPPKPLCPRKTIVDNPLSCNCLQLYSQTYLHWQINRKPQEHAFIIVAAPIKVAVLSSNPMHRHIRTFPKWNLAPFRPCAVCERTIHLRLIRLRSCLAERGFSSTIRKY